MEMLSPLFGLLDAKQSALEEVEWRGGDDGGDDGLRLAIARGDNGLGDTHFESRSSEESMLTGGLLEEGSEKHVARWGEGE
jgi:hypothetical protein